VNAWLFSLASNRSFLRCSRPLCTCLLALGLLLPPLLVARFLYQFFGALHRQPARKQCHLNWLLVFPEDVCSLPAHSAGRGEQAAPGLFPIALPIQLRMFIFCFSPVAHFPSRWIFAPRREGWIWQSNRFHHFPDCTGTVMIGQVN